MNSGAAIDAAILIEVKWGGTNVTKYGDRTFTGDAAAYLPRIVEIGEIDAAQNSDSSGMSNSVSVTLSDIDGSLKAIIDTNDIHFNPVTIYQYFVGSNLADKIKLFDGVISTPIEWDEGKRTLQFDVVTKLEDFEVGFSIDMVPAQNLPYKLLGKPFPMIFGHVMHAPAMQIRDIPSAFTKQEFGIVDYSLVLEIAKLGAQIGAFPKINIAKICSDFWIWKDEGCSQQDANDAAMEEGKQLQQQLDQLTLQMRDLQRVEIQQQAFQRSRVALEPTMQVTYPYNGVLRIGNELYHGKLDNTGGHVDTTTPLLQPGNLDITKQLTKAGYIFNNAGTQVQIAGPYPIPYIVSIIPGTVNSVYAMHSFKGLQQLTKIPTSYYTVSTENYGVPTVVVTMHQPLSTTAFLYNLQIQNWENNFGQFLPPHIVTTIDWADDIYVEFTSSVGPNPVDIMKYIIDNYSGLSYDGTSFDAVHAQVASTPMNFVYQSLSNVMDILTQLAYQARCAIYVEDDTFYLKFLPAPGDPVDSISESDVNVGTLKVTTTATESLVTVYEATFRPDYSPFFEEPIKAIFRFNVAKYGYHQEGHDFFAFNQFAVVEKVATFWMIRKSMTFKILKVQCYLHKLKLQIFDAVTLNFTRTFVSTTPCVGIVMNARYNAKDKTYDLEIWTPVRLGEMVPYSNALFTGQELEFFPTYRDIQAGSAGGQSGGEKFEFPPTNGVQINIDLGSRSNWTRGDSQPLSNFYGNEEDQPYGVDGMLYQIPTDGPNIDNYQFPVDVPADQTQRLELSKIFPAEIIKYDKVVEGFQQYRVNIYRKGLHNNPSGGGVLQLQIDQRDRIPEKSACFVIENLYDSKKKDDDGNPIFIAERTMLVPIFLK